MYMDSQVISRRNGLVRPLNCRWDLWLQRQKLENLWPAQAWHLPYGLVRTCRIQLLVVHPAEAKAGRKYYCVLKNT